MKLSSVILLSTFTLLLIAMVVCNILLKKEFDIRNTNDRYWNYGKILDKPFKHLFVRGGNLTNISFEQSDESSVRVLKNWDGFEKKFITAQVSNDTLFVDFTNIGDADEKNFLKWNTVVRIFSPELLSAGGVNTSIRLFKIHQKSFVINLSGRSSLRLESFEDEMNDLTITLKDSTEVALLKGSYLAHAETWETLNLNNIISTPNLAASKWDPVKILRVTATVEGISKLDLGETIIDSLNLHASNSSEVTLSGTTLKKPG